MPEQAPTYDELMGGYTGSPPTQKPTISQKETPAKTQAPKPSGKTYEELMEGEEPKPTPITEKKLQTYEELMAGGKVEVPIRKTYFPERGSYEDLMEGGNFIGSYLSGGRPSEIIQEPQKFAPYPKNSPESEAYNQYISGKTPWTEINLAGPDLAFLEQHGKTPWKEIQISGWGKEAPSPEWKPFYSFPSMRNLSPEQSSRLKQEFEFFKAYGEKFKKTQSAFESMWSITPSADTYNFMMSEGSYEIIREKEPEPSHKWALVFDMSRASKSKYPLIFDMSKVDTSKAISTSNSLSRDLNLEYDPVNPFSPIDKTRTSSIPIISSSNAVDPFSTQQPSRPALIPELTPQQKMYPYTPAKEIWFQPGEKFIGKTERAIAQKISGAKEYLTSGWTQNIDTAKIGTPRTIPKEKPELVSVGVVGDYVPIEVKTPKGLELPKESPYATGETFIQTVALSPIATVGSLGVTFPKYSFSAISEATTKKGLLRTAITLPISPLMPLAPAIALTSGGVKLPVETIGAGISELSSSYKQIKELPLGQKFELGAGIITATALIGLGAKGIKSAKTAKTSDIGIYRENVPILERSIKTPEITSPEVSIPKEYVPPWQVADIPKASVTRIGDVGVKAIRDQKITYVVKTQPEVPVLEVPKTIPIDTLIVRDPKTGLLRFAVSTEKIRVSKDVKVPIFESEITPRSQRIPQQVIDVIGETTTKESVPTGGIIQPSPSLKSPQPNLLDQLTSKTPVKLFDTSLESPPQTFMGKLGKTIKKEPLQFHEETIAISPIPHMKDVSFIPTIPVKRVGTTLFKKGTYTASKKAGVSISYPDVLELVPREVAGTGFKGGKLGKIKTSVIQEGDIFAEFIYPTPTSFTSEVVKGGSLKKPELVYVKPSLTQLRQIEFLEEGIGTTPFLVFPPTTSFDLGISLKPETAPIPISKTKTTSKIRQSIISLPISREREVIKEVQKPKAITMPKTVPKITTTVTPRVFEVTTTTPRVTPITTPIVTPFTTPITTPYTATITTPIVTPIVTPITTPYTTPITILRITPIIEPKTTPKTPPPPSPLIPEPVTKKRVPVIPSISFPKTKSFKVPRITSKGKPYKFKARIYPLADYMSVMTTEAKTGKKAKHQLPTFEVKRKFVKTIKAKPYAFTFPTVQMLKMGKSKGKKLKRLI